AADEGDVLAVGDGLREQLDAVAAREADAVRDRVAEREDLAGVDGRARIESGRTAARATRNSAASTASTVATASAWRRGTARARAAAARGSAVRGARRGSSGASVSALAWSPFARCAAGRR